MDNESFDTKNKGEIIYPQITPKKPIHKKEIDLFLNNKNNYSIDSFQNIENNEEKNNNIKNKATINGEKKVIQFYLKNLLLKQKEITK